MSKVRSYKVVDANVREIAKTKSISLMDAIDIYTAERAKHGIAVLWDEDNGDSFKICLREQWVGKEALR